MATRIDVTHHRGLYWVQRYAVYDSVTGVQLTLDDVDAYFMVKENIEDEDADALVEKSLGDGIAVFVDSDSKEYLDVTLNAADDADTDEMDAGFRFYDLQIVDEHGNEAPVAYGLFEVRLPVRRNAPAG